MTSSSLSPIKRSYLKKRIYYKTIPKMIPSTTITISYHLPDLVNDILIEQQRKENIVNIARILRKVGDQMDEQLQINEQSSTVDALFGQRTLTLLNCLSHILRCFL